jgi:threonine dehydratase
VCAAAARLRGVAHRTPVLTSPFIDRASGASFHFKCENLQHAGAFKFRGAYNALLRLDEAQRRRGVVAFSSGNHAQAVALAARLLDIPATIVMPQDAPALKLSATRDYGARVVLYDRYREDRAAISERLAEEQGLALVPPFDHPDVIAGQGTVALEFLEQAGPLDFLFMPLGGGGLLAGCLLVAEALHPACQVYGVEPEAGDDGRQSLRRGERVCIAVPRTIADGAQTQQLGQLTFAVIRRAVTEILVVPDASLLAQMQLLATHLKITVEATGCLGAAGAASIADKLAGKRVGVILSGGNVDPAAFQSAGAAAASAGSAGSSSSNS